MTDQLIHQRIRNRLLEILEWIMESEATPPSLGFNALINCWDDWTCDSKQAKDFPAPVYSANEGQLLIELGEAINTFCKVTPKLIENEKMLCVCLNGEQSSISPIIHMKK